MLEASIKKNDALAKWFIYSVSVIVFIVVLILSRIQLKISLSFNAHVFAFANAVINSIVSVLLILALVAVKKRRYRLHKKIMIAAILMSVLFLISYIAHHLLAGETKFGDLDHNGIISDVEKGIAGNTRYLYYTLLLTHIPMAAIILPFILFTAYRGLTGEYSRHKKIARTTWPLWLFVSLSGVLVYLLISPYYN